MTEHWGGAQWVLATWMVIFSVLPTMLRIAKPNPETSRMEWCGAELSRWMQRLTLIAVLYWGGFWS